MDKNKSFADNAVERIERTAKLSKTVPIPPGKTIEQVHDEIARDGMAWLQVFQALHFLAENPLVNVSPSALDFVRVVRELARNGAMTYDARDAMAPIDALLPLGEYAQPFKERAGRPRRPGPVRAWLRKYMTKHPEATAAQAWAALAKRPPKKMQVFDNRLGKYIETDGHPDTSYRWFATMVSQERPKK